MNRRTNDLPRPVTRRLVFSSALAALLAGCGGPGGPDGEASPPALLHGTGSAATTGNGLVSNGLVSNGLVSNGMVSNGMVSNGMVSNGLVSNGLVSNGLVSNGLETDMFHAWWASVGDEYAAMVMEYVVACAREAGETLVYESADRRVHRWRGTLGLAPAWSAGAAMPPSEQELVTACLAAHVHPDGRRSRISVRGFHADGTTIAIDPGEEEAFVRREGAFFGNLVAGTGVFACDDDNDLAGSRTVRRRCAAADVEPGMAGACAPMVFTGRCADLCSRRDPADVEYETCSWEGIPYRPLTTRLLRGP